jgi:hypothetical protein
MPIGDQDQRRVALAVTAMLGGGDQLVDLGRRQVFPLPQLRVGAPERNCPILAAWRDHLQVRFHRPYSGVC